MNWKKIFWMVAKTFLQAFGGYMGSTSITDDKTLRVVYGAAIASGLCAVMNIDWDKLVEEKADTAESEEKADE